MGYRKDNNTNWLGEEPLGAEWCQELAAVTGEVSAQGVSAQSSGKRATGSEQGKCFLLLRSCCLQGNGTFCCLPKDGQGCIRTHLALSSVLPGNNHLQDSVLVPGPGRVISVL